MGRHQRLFWLVADIKTSIFHGTFTWWFLLCKAILIKWLQQTSLAILLSCIVWPHSLAHSVMSISYRRIAASVCVHYMCSLILYHEENIMIFYYRWIDNTVNNVSVEWINHSWVFFVSHMSCIKIDTLWYNAFYVSAIEDWHLRITALLRLWVSYKRSRK